jgi:hypothetical protein
VRRLELRDDRRDLVEFLHELVGELLVEGDGGSGGGTGGSDFGDGAVGRGGRAGGGKYRVWWPYGLLSLGV